MRKLKLEELRVDSFVTSPAPVARGTVRGHDGTENCTAFCANTGRCSGVVTYTCDNDTDTYPDPTTEFPNTTTNVH